jgi:hypothetical protein
LVNTVNSAFLSAWFGQSSTFGVSGDLIAQWANARAGAASSTTPTAAQDPNAPIAPVWTPGVSPADAALVQRALENKAFFDKDAKLYSDLGATGDYKKLFALYSGLTMLNALAGRAGEDGLSKADFTKTQAQFSRGLSELQAFFASEKFEDVRMVQTDRTDSAQTTLAMTTKSEDYVTGVIHRGATYQTLSGLPADAKFEITALSQAGTERNVTIDLAQMGSIPRSLSNVVGFINSKLSAAGVASRIETVDKTPKENTLIIGGRQVTTKYTGAKQYALKVDVRANERVSFDAVAGTPAFYALGDVNGGARLIKLQDTGGAAGQPVWLERPGATSDPIGAYVSEGWQAGAGAYEQRSNALMSAGLNTIEDKLRGASEAVLKVQTADGRTLSVTTAWRSEDQENWLGDDDAAMMGDLAQRLTQLLHEQGVAASVEAWEDNGNHGLSVKTGDFVTASSLSIGGKAVTFTNVDPAGMVGGLRDGVFARRFEAAAVASASELFEGKQSFAITTSSGTQTITIDGGDDGIDAATLVTKLNEKLRAGGIAAAAYLDDVGGALTLRFDTLHSVTAVSATLNEDEHDAVLQAPGAWASGGLPTASAGQPFGDAVRTSNAASAPLLTHTGALDIAVVVSTPTGDKTINVSVSALERANDPDVAPGEWSAAFQARLDAALNEAGVYVSGGSDLTQWSAAEGAGHRIKSVTVNGDALALTADAPVGGVGGAFSADRSFTSANIATAVDDDVAALLSDQSVSITFNTIWGARTVSATLEPGDPRTLESAALRLNEALAAQGYDLGVAATALSGGGAGLRLVTGASASVRGVSEINLGGVAHDATLDPVDSQTFGGNPVGALRVSERAARGANVLETVPGASAFTAPSNGVANWFPGRAFDVSIGGGAKVATARAVAAGADGSVYVLADLNGDSATSAIKGARDVALMKYDSAGTLVFSEILGASQSANGFALAVSADGTKVAVAGSVEGALSDAGPDRGGTDSFVAMFDSSGKEIWAERRGAKGNDEALAISFMSNGGVVITGRTESALGPALSAGKTDAYVRGFNANGLELFQKQFGTTGDDAATALLVRDNGVGGFSIFTGGVENNRGVVRSFTYSPTAGFSTGATRDIGYFYKGAVNTLAWDNGALYVGGEVGADRLTVGATAQGSVAGQEGFVARLDDDLVSTALDRTSYLGSSGDDSVKSLAIVNGDVYAAGVAVGVINGVGSSGLKSSFVTRLGDDGASDWTRTFMASTGTVTLTGLAFDQSGTSPLDVLGLPRGTVAARDSNALVNRSALREGDEFQIGMDGRRLTTIKIGANDTLSGVANAINRAIGGAGRAVIVREDGVERIKITANDGKAVKIEPGREGRDALGALGLKQGVVAVNKTGAGQVQTFGLSLVTTDLKINDKTAIAATKAELSAAISMVRQAYDALLNPNAKELTEEEKALRQRRLNAGAAPEYYSTQLNNYKAALARLTGG